jgi:hypothetical protein
LDGPHQSAAWEVGCILTTMKTSILNSITVHPAGVVSAGYSPDLDGLLTGTSVSGSFGRRSIRPNIGASDSSIGVGIGTPGFGATYGWGPYKMDPAPLEAIGEINPAIYSTGFDLPDVNRQDSFDDRFGKWGTSSSGVAPASAPGLPGQPSGRFGSWGTAPANDFDNSLSPVLRELEKYRRAAAPDRVPPASFDDRFGSWPSSTPTQPPSGPAQPNPQKSMPT